MIFTLCVLCVLRGLKYRLLTAKGAETSKARLVISNELHMNSDVNIFNSSARRYEPDAGIFLKKTNRR